MRQIRTICEPKPTLNAEETVLAHKRRIAAKRLTRKAKGSTDTAFASPKSWRPASPYHWMYRPKAGLDLDRLIASLNARAAPKIPKLEVADA